MHAGKIERAVTDILQFDKLERPPSRGGVVQFRDAQRVLLCRRRARCCQRVNLRCARVEQIDRFSAAGDLSAVIALDVQSFAAFRADRARAERGDLRRNIQAVARFDNGARQEGERNASSKTPSADIDREGVRISQFDVFLVLVARGRIALETAERDLGIRSLWLRQACRGHCGRGPDRGLITAGIAGLVSERQMGAAGREISALQRPDRSAQRLRLSELSPLVLIEHCVIPKGEDHLLNPIVRDCGNQQLVNEGA